MINKSSLLFDVNGQPFCSPHASLRIQIDSVPRKSILFISAPTWPHQLPSLDDADDPDDTNITTNVHPNALYGGLMTNRAEQLSCAGTIVNGRIRDLDEHRDLGFPVFATGVGTASPGTEPGELAVQAINGPITLSSSIGGSTTIHPNDYLLADINGVVHIPRSLVEKVVALIPSQVQADELIRTDLSEGRGFEESARERRKGVLRAEDV